MRLFNKYRPRTLTDIVGQPPVHYLRSLAADPYSCCLLFDGPPGVGKTAAAFALAHDLGCYDQDTWPAENPPVGALANCTGLFCVDGSELGIDTAKELLGHTLRLRYGSSSGFNVLVIEELEWLSKQCQVHMKRALETKLPKNLIVIATTNDPTGLGKALLQRFKKYHFSAGPTFATAAVDRLHWIWARECPNIPAPQSLPDWGWDGDQFSLRVALDEMQDHLAVRPSAVCLAQ